MSKALTSPADLAVLVDLPGRAEPKVKFEHIPALDGMRAIAVLLVVVFHAALVFPAVKPYVTGGFMGVDVFFVLSGFLITSILLQEFDRTETISFKNFYMRRFLRLMPAYWVQLAVLFLFATLLFPKNETDQLYGNNNFLYAVFYLTNWQRALNGSQITGLLSHTWSLAIEEQFYLFWAGFLFLMLRRLKRNSIMATTGGIILFTVWFRAFRWHGTESVDFLYNAFDSRMDALLIGCLVSQLISWQILPKSFLASRWFDLMGLFSLWVAVAIVFNLSNSYFSPFLYLGGFTIFALAVGIIVIWLVERSKNGLSRILTLRPMIWIGKTSYGLYLWHAIAISYVYYFDWQPLTKLAAAMVISFSLTALSYYLLELPFLRLKARFK